MTHSIKFDERFKKATIESIKPFFIQARLDDNAIIRIHTEDSHTSSYHIDDSIDVFITAYSDKKKYYYGSILWADIEQNPWLNNPPQEDEIYEGIAHTYPNTVNAVLIELKNGLMGILHQEDTPYSTKNIKDIIDIGDQLIIGIKDIDSDSLRIYLSLNKALQHQASTERERQLRYYDTDSIKKLPVSTIKISPPSTSKVREIGVLGFDTHFTHHLMSWLTIYGYRTIPINNIHQLKVKTTPINAPSHLILCSSPLHAPHDEIYPLLTSIKNKDICMIWLAEPNQQPPKGVEIPTLPEKVELHQVIGLLEHCRDDKHEHDFSDEDKNIEKAFTFRAYQEERVSKLASNLLKKICTEFEIAGALWVVRERAGVFNPRAAHNIENSNLKKHSYKFGQTIISNCIEEDKQHHIEIANSGDLIPISPIHIGHIWALPLPFQSLDETRETTERAIIFFSRQKLSQKNCRKITTKYLGVMQAFVETLLFAQHNESLTVFARIGYSSASSMHEIARQVNTIKDQVVAMQERPSEHNYTDINQLLKNVKNLEQLSQNNMQDIMTQSSHSCSVKEIVTSLATEFQHRATAQGTAFEVTLPDAPLHISLPRLAISHAIRNLLDNAFYFIKNTSTYSYVKLDVHIDRKLNNETPLFIDIIDNGSGIKASMIDRLFKPRHSEKENIGIGMGLHISRGLIRGIGGDLILRRSIRWKQTIFRIQLPIILKRQEK